MDLPVLRWGILGCGHIAGRFAGEVATLGGRASLRAVGARDPARAASFAATYGVERSGGYEAVLADPEVDAVYISLLNRDHARWSIAAAEAGKRILCEKPAALTAAELATMLDAARRARVLWVEAFAYRFHPRWQALRRLAAGLGGPVSASASFSFAAVPMKERLLDPLGGGALLDVGCYPLSLLIGLFGEPEAVACTARLATTGVDLAAAMALRFPAGHVAQALCGCDAGLPQQVLLAGPGGDLRIDEPFRNRPEAVFFHRGESVPWSDDGLPLYAREALAVAAAHDRQEHPDMPWVDSLATARVLDTCREQVGVRW